MASAGYYTIDETPAPASLHPLCVHGPIFPTIYGFIAHFVGWTTYLPSSLMFDYRCSPDLFTWLNLIKTVGLPWADYCHFLSSTAIFTLHYAGKLALCSCNFNRISCNRQIQHRKWSIFIIGFSLFSLFQL